MRLNFFSKLLLIFLCLFLTFLYAKYERKKYYGSETDQSADFVLKTLPEFNVVDVRTQASISSKKFLEGSNGIFVHIWGTWCAPCEKEMPEFLAYATKLEAKGLKFLLVAVNDEEAKIMKYLSRFPVIPKNVTIAMDKENKVMDLLGTLKVPETFLFNPAGKHINKFIGPQDWMAESYETRLSFWLNGQNLNDRKIETH